MTQLEEQEDVKNWDDSEKGKWLFDRFLHLYRENESREIDVHVPFDWCVMCDLYNLYPFPCLKCQKEPCIIYQDRQLLMDVVTMKVVGRKPNNECRFLLYKEFTRRLHGYLGKNNRRELPECITTFTRKMFPEQDGQYTRFKNNNDV